jgi:hypothetical protein
MQLTSVRQLVVVRYAAMVFATLLQKRVRQIPHHLEQLHATVIIIIAHVLAVYVRVH